MLAQLPEDTVRGIVSRVGMPTPTEHSIGNVDELLTELAAIRERGYSIDDEEQELGVRCYAITVPGAPSPTAISVSGPLARVDESFGERAVPLLKAAASQIASEMNVA
jgi:IclR family acetate operon transcriptional repressor